MEICRNIILLTTWTSGNQMSIQTSHTALRWKYSICKIFLELLLIIMKYSTSFFSIYRVFNKEAKEIFSHIMILHFPSPYIWSTKYGLRHYIYKCVSINQGINSRYSRIWYPISSMRWGCKHHIHRNADNISLLLPPLYFACCTQNIVFHLLS